MAAIAPHTRDRPGRAHRALRGRELTVSLVAIIAGAVVFAAVPEFRHSVSIALHGDFAGLRRYVRGLGAGGMGLLLALMLAHAVVFYPTEIVTATAAFVFGFLPGLAFVTGGWLASALLSYVLGRVIGRPLLRTVLGPRFGRLERSIERGGTPLLLVGRLIPIVPFSLMGYAAGATHVRVWRFAWTTVVGFLPLTAAVAFLGSRAETLSAGDPIMWSAALLVVFLLVSARVVAVRRRRSADDGQDTHVAGELQAGSARGQAETTEDDLPIGSEK